MGRLKINRYWTEQEKQKLRELYQKIKENPEFAKLTPRQIKRKLLQEAKNVFSSRSELSIEAAIKRYTDWTQAKDTKVVQSTTEQAVAQADNKDKIEEIAIKKQSTKVTEFIEWLKKGSRTVREASEYLGIAKIKVYDFISELRENYGYDIIEEGGLLVLRREAVEGQPVKLKGIKRREIKVGLIAKIGIGLKTFQGTLLKTAFETFKKEKVDFVAIIDLTGGCPGRNDKRDFMERLSDNSEIEEADNNEISNDKDSNEEGKPKKKKKVKKDYYFEEQVNFAVKHLSQLNLPFKVYVIAGERDMRHKTAYGQNVVAAICQQVKNFVYAGDMEKYFPNDSGNFRLVVADIGEATPYTKSYIAQGTAENYQSAIAPIIEKHRPDVLVLAGSHVFGYKPRTDKRKDNKTDDNDLDIIQLPSLHGILPSKTTKKRRGGSHEIGFVLLTLDFYENGVLKNLTVDCRDLTAYQKTCDYFEGSNHLPDLTEEERQIVTAISDFRCRLGALSRLINKPKSEVERIIKNLKTKGYTIIEESGYYQLKKPWIKEYQPIPSEKLYVNSCKTIDTADQHIGNKESIADEAMAETAKIVEEEKPDAILVDGDIFDGVQNHPGQDQELVDQGVDEQIEHGLRIWPLWKIPTYVIRGSSHEAKLLKVGHDMVDKFVRLLRAEKGYKYIEYIGNRQRSNQGNIGIVEINKIKTILFHPSGGIPFGLSYRLQQIIERYVAKNATAGARRISCGHLHVAYAMIYKGILAQLNPCMQRQTNYLVSKSLIPDLGIWITQVFTDDKNNLTRVVLKYHSFK